MNLRSAPVVLVPVLLSLAIVLAGAGVWLEQEESAETVRRLSREHAQTVVSLVRSATSLAVKIHAAGFADLEARLRDEAELLLDPTCTASCITQADPWLVVRVVEEGGEPQLIVWGPIRSHDRARMAELAPRDPARINVLEPRFESTRSLVCALGRRDGRTVVLCASSAALRERLRNTGPGALLREVEAGGVNYVAIQDETGVLAASPSIDSLPAIRSDPFLSRLGWPEPRAVYFRTTAFRGADVFEGIGLIDLPDGTRGLLIRMAAQRIKLELNDDAEDPHHALCSVVMSEVDRLDGLVGDFLSLSAPLSITPEPTALWPLVEEVILSLRMRSERDTQTLTVSGDSGLRAAVDRARMAQVLHNLTANALDSAGESGHVEIRLSRHQAREVAVIEVLDDGPGMSDELLERALQAFYTTKSFGTGLGLPMVKRIVEGHRGVLELRNRPQGGFCASVQVPLPRAGRHG